MLGFLLHHEPTSHPWFPVCGIIRPQKLWMDPKSRELSFSRNLVRTGVCGNRLGGGTDRGDMPIERGDSWFSKKPVLAGDLSMSCRGRVPGALHPILRTRFDRTRSRTSSAKIRGQEGKSPDIQEKAFKPGVVNELEERRGSFCCRLRSSHLERKA